MNYIKTLRQLRQKAFSYPDNKEVQFDRIIRAVKAKAVKQQEKIDLQDKNLQKRIEEKYQQDYFRHL